MKGFFSFTQRYVTITRYKCEHCPMLCDMPNCRCGNNSIFYFIEHDIQEIEEHIIYSDIIPLDGDNIWFSTFIDENGEPYRFNRSNLICSKQKDLPRRLRILRYTPSRIYCINPFFQIMIKRWKCRRMRAQAQAQIKAIILACRRRKDIFSFCTIYNIITYLSPHIDFRSMVKRHIF